MAKPNIEPFEQYADRYAEWFERHPAAYASELAAVRELWPPGAAGVEIGVGAGHFAAPLGIPVGLDPSPAMRQRAAAQGLRVVDGVAEDLPFDDASFAAALMVTTLCFVNDPVRSTRELFRILRPGGCAVIGLVDRTSRLGLEYEARRDNSLFYRQARFFSIPAVTAQLAGAGFVNLEYRQTLFGDLATMLEPEPVKTGYGGGAFVVVRGHKQELPRC